MGEDISELTIDEVSKLEGFTEDVEVDEEVPFRFGITVFKRKNKKLKSWRLIDPNKLISIAQDKGLNPTINQIESIKDWEFNDLIYHSYKGKLTEHLALLEKEELFGYRERPS